MFSDSHCHIHEADFPLAVSDVLASAARVGVETVVTMGDSVESSRRAVSYVKANQNKGVRLLCYVGIHPHETSAFTLGDTDVLRGLVESDPNLVRGIGEIGLDYYYDFCDHTRQITALEAQLQLAADLKLPVSLHVRSGKGGDAFADFWAVMDNFRTSQITGALHSFTDNMTNLEGVLAHNLYVGVNGIITFNKDPGLNEVYKRVPLTRMLLETDAPYLAPVPHRGKPNQPSYIPQIATKVAELNRVSVEDAGRLTTGNLLELIASRTDNSPSK